MKKILFLLLLCCSVFASDIQDQIQSETLAINDTPLWHDSELSAAYAARGESYLIAHEMGLAFEDLKKANEYAIACDDQENRLELEFRVLFDILVFHHMINSSENLFNNLEYMNEVITFLQCQGCEEVTDEMVDYTPGLVEPIADLVSNAQKKTYLLNIIDLLENRCTKCTYTLKFWESCTTPLLKKYRSWQ